MTVMIDNWLNSGWITSIFKDSKNDVLILIYCTRNITINYQKNVLDNAHQEIN